MEPKLMGTPVKKAEAEGGNQTVQISRQLFDKNVKFVDQYIKEQFSKSNENHEWVNKQLAKVYSHFQHFKEMAYGNNYWDYRGQDAVNVRMGKLMGDFFGYLNPEISLTAEMSTDMTGVPTGSWSDTMIAVNPELLALRLARMVIEKKDLRTENLGF